MILLILPRCYASAMQERSTACHKEVSLYLCAMQERSNVSHKEVSPYLGAMQERSNACHKVVIMRSQQGMVKRPSEG